MKYAMQKRILRLRHYALSGACAVYLMLLNVYPLQAQLAYSAPVKNYQYFQEKDNRITLQVKNEKLQTILDKIEKKSRFVFVFSNDEINTDQKVTFSVKDKELTDALAELLTPLRIHYEMVKDKIILKPANRSNNPLVPGSSGAATTLEGAATARQRADTLITGRVVDDKGLGLGNISVQLKGTVIGTTTNSDGSFSLRIPDDRKNGVLVLSSVGYIEQEVPIAGNQLASVTLLPDTKDLGEVVVVGYGTQRRISVTGAVDAVGRKAVEGRPVVNMSQALQGQSPNLIIQQSNFEPGQGMNINIRGLGTLGSNDPLVVIDGIPGGDLNLVNPNDIESVSVLKDAGTAAIYGSRSANGVILITTRKGKKNATPTVTYNGIYGIQSPRITYEPVHAWENAYYKNESLVNSGLAPAFTPSQIQEFARRGDGDWRVDNIVKDASQQTHNVTVTGGGANNTYMLSVGMMDQKNNFIGDYGYKRYNVRLNHSYDIGKLKLSTIMAYTRVDNKDHSYVAGTLLVDASRVPLYYSFQDSAGNYLTNPVSAQFNPKAILERGGYRKYDNDEMFGNFTAEYQVFKDLKIRGVLGGTLRANQMNARRMQLNFIPGGVYGDDREVRNTNYKQLFTNLQLLAEYDKKIGDHNIKVLAGGTNESSKQQWSRLAYKFADPELGIPTDESVFDPTNFGPGGTNADNGSRPATIETSLNSLLGRLAYSYKDKYFIEGNFRYDGSSNFLKANRWGFFPSVAAAWRFSEESFLSYLSDNIGDFKLRASWGELGNQNVYEYQYQTFFVNQQNAYAFGGNPATAAVFDLGNPNLTWEKAATFNVGIDASLLNRRLEVSFDYFNKTTRDILFSREDIPDIFGVRVNELPDYNVAKVRNKGWEFRASYNLPGRLINQTFSVNLADNLNEVLQLTYGANERIVRKEEFELLRRVGQPITVYYGYKRDGYFQTPEDINKYPKFEGSTVVPGDIKYVDRNGDGVINDQDKFILGNPFPRYTFGFTYSATIKGFDVVLFIQGVGKRDAMIRGEQVEPFHFGYGGTMYRHQTDYWTPTNPNAKYPRLAEAGSSSNSNNYRVGSDLYLFDASYVRLKNVQIGYTLPTSISSKAHIKKARLYLTGQNLVTLTKLAFLDPEITEFNNRVSFDAGANSARAYFLPVFYGFGLDLTF
jgi:TonB-linked outer membrane protein, SusC/RagA family